MEYDEAAKSLRALAASIQNRSKIGRVRMLYPEIENARKSGASLETIVETLNKHCFGLTIFTFKTMLYRVRKELKRNSEILTATIPTAKLKQKAEMKISKDKTPTPSSIEKKHGEPCTFNWDIEKNTPLEW